MIPFTDRVRDILYDRHISIHKFASDTGISRENFFYRKNVRYSHRRYIYMAIAYYFGMKVEDLIAGTDGELDFYGDEK